MISYGEAKNRAKRETPDWNQRKYLSRAVITWCDDEYEYDCTVENEDNMSDDEFKAFIEENAEEFATEDAENNDTKFCEIMGIRYKEDYIDDDALFDKGYEAACEFEWVTKQL